MDKKKVKPVQMYVHEKFMFFANKSEKKKKNLNNESERY